MSTTELLAYAARERPRFFSPGFDVEVFDQAEEKWGPAIGSEHSINSLAEGLEAGTVDESAVRFSSDETEEYLRHLTETGVDDEIHQEELLDREQLIALADEGYTAPEDFIGTDDAVDIGRASGVDRDIVQKIASKHIGGFSSAGSFGGGPFSDVEPRTDFEGWDLVSNSETRIRWSSAGRFRLTIKPTSSGGVTITTNAPNEERTAWYRKGWSPSIGDEETDADGALKAAHEWLDAHELAFEDDLATVPQIGPSTKDYLAIEYGVLSFDELETFLDENAEEAAEIFGDDVALVIGHFEE